MARGLTKRMLLEKLAQFPDDTYVYVGGQCLNGNIHSVYACPIINVESATVHTNDYPEILLIEDTTD